MANLTFKQFLSTIVVEDVQADIAKLTTDISMIDAQINQRTTPLLQRKMQLQKMLALKQKQAQVDVVKDPAAPNGQQPQAGATPPSNQTTTPGGSRSATPGNAPSINQ